MPGTLYVVATPIGNLEDITQRALRVLREADRIACEDTRQTRRLLDHYGISARPVSYHEHNERARAEELISELEAGRSIALVCDAGTPLIADPGYRIVSEARARGIAVVPIPGPSAMIAALSASGLPSDRFCFFGFLPPRTAQRRKALESARDLDATLVFYEAPHRILQMLEDLDATLGARRVVIARELTKIHEEFLSGAPLELRAELASRPAVKGEFTVMVGRAEEGAGGEEADVGGEVESLMAGGMARMEAIKTVARRHGLAKREVYRGLMSRADGSSAAKEESE